MNEIIKIDTDSKHVINVVITGDRSKIPVVIFHGGPGSKSKEKHLKFYDFEKVYTIQIDQRGCGESTPSGSIENNTTQDLVNDIDHVRQKLKIDRWVVSGASWGSTLALLYAEEFSNNVLGLFLGNIFLAREKDSAWLFDKDGVRRFYPDLWQYMLEQMKKHNVPQDNFNEYIYEVLKGEDFVKKQVVGSIIGSWERNLMTTETSFSFPKPEDLSEEDINSMKLYLHYEVNDFFIKDNQIINNIEKIENIPTAIIHGRFDAVCPPEQAYLLHQKLNKSRLEITSNDGHKVGVNAGTIGRYLFEWLVSDIQVIQ